MKVALARPARTAWRFVSVTVASVPMIGDMPMLELLILLALYWLLKNLRKSMASGDAFLPTAMPFPPPTPSVAAPLPFATVGKGDQPRSVPMPFLVVLSAAWTVGAHWPITSIAALALPTAAASMS